MPPHCYSGPPPGSRPLALQTPMQTGLDARLLQLGLSENGLAIVADGIFGKGSVAATRAYQASKGHPPTGVADVPLIVELTAPFR
jgi:chitosanase